MAAQSKGLDTLLNALSDRQIDQGRDDVAWAFESPQTKDAATAWVDEYLTSTTFLSQEELHLYTALGRQGRVSSSRNDGSNGRPREDSDFEAALHALEASTTAIQRQCDVLETQKAALLQLQADSRASAANSRTRGMQQRDRTKPPPSQARLDGQDVESLHQRIAIAQQQAETDITSTRALAERRLEADDKTFKSLQTALGVLDSLKADNSTTSDVEQMCSQLVTIHNQALRKTMNHVFEDALERGKSMAEEPSFSGADEGEVGALTDELDTLMAEVEPVLRMVVDHEHRRPLLEMLREAEQGRQAQQRQIRQSVNITSLCMNVTFADTQQIKHSLSDMTEQLHRLTKHTADLDAYSSALAALSSVFADTTVTSPQQAPQTTKPVQSRGEALKAMLHASDDPAVKFLKQFEVRVPATARSDDAQVRQHLDTAIAQLKARVTDLEVSTEQGVSSELNNALTAADGELRCLSDALHAYSPYGTIHLDDQELAVRLARLDAEVQQASGKVASMNVEDLVAASRSQVRRALGA